MRSKSPKPSINRAIFQREGQRLAALSYGEFVLPSVGAPAIEAGFFTLKGILETWFRSLGYPRSGYLSRKRAEPRASSCIRASQPRSGLENTGLE